MSSHNKKVMSLEDKVGIIHKFEALGNRREMNAFMKSNAIIIANKEKILAQYDDMKAKLAAVRDLVITEYGKPNFMSEKHAFLQKIMVEWYRRAIQKHRKVSLSLLGHNTDTAMRILNITGLPMSESQICALKRNCHQASLQRKSIIDESSSSTLCLRKIAQEMLTEMGIPKATALRVYGPNIFEEGRDKNEDGVGNSCGKRKLKQKELPSNKCPRTSNGKHELNRSDVVQSIESEEEDTDAAHPYDCIWPYEPEVEEEEDFELYDVISVADSAEEFDAATSAECTQGSEKEAEIVLACTVVKAEPGEGEPDYSSENRITITDVRERVDEWLIKKEDEEACASLVPLSSIKIESEGLALCDGMSTTTSFQDCVKQEPHSDLDENYTATSEDGIDADRAAPSTKNDICVDSVHDAMRTLELIKGYLKQQKNHRALEALAKVEAAFPRSDKGSKKCKKSDLE